MIDIGKESRLMSGKYTMGLIINIQQLIEI